MAEGRVLYALRCETCFLRFEGKVRYTSCAGLEEFIDEVFCENAPEEAIIDLTAATLIDSTNLGLLARIARCMMQRRQRKPAIISTNEDVNTVLTASGFTEVFKFITSTDEAADLQVPLEVVPESDRSEIERTRTILEAHKELMALNEANRNVFANVVEMLEKDLKRKCDT